MQSELNSYATKQEPNVLGVNGPRKMTVILPAMTKEGGRIKIIPGNVKA